VLADTYPDAEIILIGVEEPLTLMHAPDESVDPSEIATMALAEALRHSCPHLFRAILLGDSVPLWSGSG
jgi:hypothetical protein